MKFIFKRNYWFFRFSSSKRVVCLKNYRFFNELIVFRNKIKVNQNYRYFCRFKKGLTTLYWK